MQGGWADVLIGLDALAVVLPRADHQRFTNELRAKLPYGRGYTHEKVWIAYQEVYADFPDFLQAVEKYFR